MSSKRDRKSGYIYKLCKRLETQIDQEYDAEQQQTTIKLESDSDNEQNIVFSTTTSDALLTSLKMTCSDSEESSNELPGLTEMPSVFEMQSASSTKESTIATVMNMFTSLSKQIATIHKKTDNVQREVTTISERLGRVEKKMGISLATMELVKDVIVNGEETPQRTHETTECFDFSIITNEEEFTAFDTKLGTDKEYYSKVKTDLSMQIHANEPNNRLFEAMDIIFARTFMVECSWTGHGAAGPKIAFGKRTNILKLFADIASNKFRTISQTFVQEFFMKKLRHAKERLNSKGVRKAVCRKRISKMPIATHAEKKAK
ncbi:uncharacterized protein LOC125771075 isoform X3 [Anopheles funestus]|uniref:DUF4806 domain-containing protein n=1 Tax=Anopheles funestus TaxID=62324 RepID=A0A4Y0BIG2_ANOFN|nr:uncharacterized protein LOC125771075 [Anopheles funestus]XP_049297241.1 uncharacterized protein LOC125771075 isoform X3 [Anopheles funestus]XP_049297242.1 uncharacterized protein LOC125771075 isoform X3 [Anopheles funestus]XP_049297243.1 uncharacterized protein LOC125771075 isoform X3 [Anopheles funestus]